MRIASAFLLRSNSRGDEAAAKKGGAKANRTDEKDVPMPALPSTSSAVEPPQNEVGRVERLRLGAQSAMNHLIYGKWRRNAGRMPRLDGIFGGQNEGEGEVLLWLLGRAYKVAREEPGEAAEGMEEEEEGGESGLRVSDEFLEDFRSRIWLSYRERFPPLLAKTGPSPHQMATTTDCGWGCTLRSLQMLLAQAFSQLRLGRNFRLSKCQCQSPQHGQLISILRLFEDCPNSPLGLHSLLEMATERGWHPTIGRWYSPSQAALLLRDALLVGMENGRELCRELCLVVCADNCVVLSELWPKGQDKAAVPLLLVIPLRLGTENVNEIYMDHIRHLFTLDSFLGMVGGRARNAVYLVGCLDRVLFTLDPHVVQSYRPLDGEEAGEEEQEKKWASFHCQFPGAVQMEDLDPSCALGFLIRDEKEKQEWVQAMADSGLVELHTAERKSTQPNALFTILEEKQQFWEDQEKNGKMKGKGKEGKRRRKSSGKGPTSPDGSADAEFELL